MGHTRPKAPSPLRFAGAVQNLSAFWSVHWREQPVNSDFWLELYSRVISGR